MPDVATAPSPAIASYRASAEVLGHSPRSGPAAAPRKAEDRKTEHQPARGAWRRFGKRAFDVTAVLLSAPAVLPVVLILGLLVMLDGASPFYRQERVGRGGRSFRILKLRTMVPNAEAALMKYLAENASAKAEWDAMQKLQKDPRITKVGRFLRKSSLDELPQLWNVLRGDMSLVGPRPMMLSQVPLYPGEAYFRLRPGITGSWQVSERHTSQFAARATYDTDYDRELSMATDLTILWRTVAVVLRGSGC